MNDADHMLNDPFFLFSILSLFNIVKIVKKRETIVEKYRM